MWGPRMDRLITRQVTCLLDDVSVKMLLLSLVVLRCCVGSFFGGSPFQCPTLPKFPFLLPSYLLLEPPDEFRPAPLHLLLLVLRPNRPTTGC